MGKEKLSTYIVKKFGVSRHPLYSTWLGMISRCYNPSNANYGHYGGRGITVCDEWRSDPIRFFEWAEGLFKKGATLDRINNSLGYCPVNCRYVKINVQNNNKRVYKNNTSGYPGVRQNYSGTFTARVKVDNKYKHIGNYPSIEEAVMARDSYITNNNLLNKISEDNVKTNTP